MGNGESRPPKSHSETIFDIAISIAGSWKMTIFDVLKIDIDEFILVANYLIKLGQESNKTKTINKTETKETRIRVNDSTATGGWF